ncbi:single-stranded-DNA-specific exonuclease RecJ [Aerococcaceae bacterium WGS1372]
MKYNLSKFIWKMKSTPETDKMATQLKNDGISYSPAFLRLCASRGINTPKQLELATDQQFQMFHDPFLLKDMDRAVERIEKAIELHELILIYGDYDADGITSTLIMYEALESIGANVHYYLPNRLTDGYGPNTDRWKALIDELGVQLFITVDNGIVGFETIKEINKLNIDTIVTDHHEIQSELPEAYAIIHPNHPLGEYPFTELSGAGVALKLASALLGEIPTESLELAAIGTVADMVSMTDENRTIVLSGLNLMKDTMRIGLSLLLEGEKVSRNSITADTIGFIIGPRLNAIGRLGDPTPALELLKTFDESEAISLLTIINEKNSERQSITKTITSEIEQKLKSYETIPNIIIESAPNWPAGILGIAASRLVNEYHRPVILFQYIEETGQYKGSSRSVSSINIFEELVLQKELLAHFGGHSQAAGLTIDETNWQRFNQAIQSQFEKYTQLLNEPEILDVDISLDINEVNLEFIDEVNLLSPFGTGNPKPRFILKDTRVDLIRKIGANSNHLKMQLTGQEGEAFKR